MVKQANDDDLDEYLLVSYWHVIIIIIIIIYTD